MKTSSKTDVDQNNTALLIETLEQGTIPWKQPWNDYGSSQNYISRKPYGGINQLILNGLHDKPYYLTFNQAVSLGGRIKKGSKSIPVTYWNFTFRDKESGRKLTADEARNKPSKQIAKSAYLKYYRVFNIEDVLNIDFDIPETIVEKDDYSIACCDAVLFEMKDRPDIRHERNEAFYNPVQDYINMPPIEHFHTAELYYSILHHELIHCVGHPKRLNRFENYKVNSYGSNDYSKEELIAEIGASFLNGHTGILNETTLTDSTAYIQGWLHNLRNDKKIIIEASAQAQKSVDYILNKGD